MRVLFANIEEVFREAAARWTLIAYFVLSSLCIIVFASAINLDVVNGTLAGAKLFGQSVRMGHSEIQIEELVTGFEGVFSSMLFYMSVFISIFATAHLVPRLQEKGTIDLYLSRPIPRIPLMLSRYVAGMVLVAANVLYLVGTMWLVVIWKTHVFHPRFMLSALLVLFAIATLLALAFLIGVVTSSTAVSIMGSFGAFFMSVVLYFHKTFEAAITNIAGVWLVRCLYWITPKLVEMQLLLFSYVTDKPLPKEIDQGLMLPIATTAAFGIACLALASWLFKRKEF